MHTADELCLQAGITTMPAMPSVAAHGDLPAYARQHLTPRLTQRRASSPEAYREPALYKLARGWMGAPPDCRFFPWPSAWARATDMPGMAAKGDFANFLAPSTRRMPAYPLTRPANRALALSTATSAATSTKYSPEQAAASSLPALTALKLSASLPAPTLLLGSLSLGDYLFPKLRLSTSKSWSETSAPAASGGWHSVGLWQGGADASKPVRASTNKIFYPTFFNAKLDDLPSLAVKFSYKPLLD